MTAMDSSIESSKRMCHNNRLDYNNNYFTVKFDRYWPHDINVDDDEPENQNLLYIKTIEAGTGNMFCKLCDKKEEKSYIELNPKLKYFSSKTSIEVELSEHPEAYNAFVDSCDIKSQKNISILQILRPIYCNNDCRTVSIIPQSEFEFSTLFRYFWADNKICVYLKLDPLSRLKIPIFLTSNLKFSQMLKTTYLNGFSDIKKNYDLVGTHDFEEAEIPSGFNLKLKDYQLRSISWMEEIESVEPLKTNTIFHDALLEEKCEKTRLKFKLGHSSFYAGFSDHEPISESPKIIPNFELLRIRSGILADDPGSGKTITTLGLIHSNPFTHEKDSERQILFGDIDKFVQSRASCVICPENIQLQWIEEAKRCNPDFKIIGLATDSDFEKVSNDQIEIADLIVISYEFLLRLITTKKHQLRPNENFDFLRIHFYRIILDELQLVMENYKIGMIVKQMRADHYWGLTGTLDLTNLINVIPYFHLSVRLENVLADNVNGHNEFIKKFAKRNKPDLQLPSLSDEIIWVNLSQKERILYDDAIHSDRIINCYHYRFPTMHAGEPLMLMSLKDVQNKISQFKNKEIDNLEKQISMQIEFIHKLREDPEIEIWLIESQDDQLKQLIKTVNEAKRKLNYFQSVFKVLGETDSNDCRICYDKIPSESLSVLPCSHIYCFECVMEAVKNSNLNCPLCHEPLRTKSDIYRIKVEVKFAGKLDTSRYSSKFIALYTYITELIESNSEAKIILISQCRELAKFIDETFKELDLRVAHVSGDVLKRQDAIKKFTESMDVRLILLSSEDGVCGINLHQATHVILLHPFSPKSSQNLDAEAIEKQGILCAYRFGLKNPLKVVRFVVKDAIKHFNSRDIEF